MFHVLYTRVPENVYYVIKVGLPVVFAVFFATHYPKQTLLMKQII